MSVTLKTFETIGKCTNMHANEIPYPSLTKAQIILSYMKYPSSGLSAFLDINKQLGKQILINLPGNLPIRVIDVSK